MSVPEINIDPDGNRECPICKTAGYYQSNTGRFCKCDCIKTDEERMFDNYKAFSRNRPSGSSSTTLRDYLDQFNYSGTYRI